MKKLLFLLLLVATLVACSDDPTPAKFKVDPNAMILLRGDMGGAAKGFVTGLTPLEVVENGVNVKYESHWAGNMYYETIQQISSTFADLQKDYDIPALKLWGVCIITMDGEYYKDFTYATNVYITDNNNDTIAQVPDEVIVNARALIEDAYNNGDYKEVYRLFNEAFTFIPFSK